ncbi:glutaminyl-peptide cyclotransferase [Pedobacter sp. Du54]|uniref:glutaminyl-peptide cyclotransferase n=1 Tax=Pedobacter anseongensis TaxID=3133439 RepID=UPI003098B15F
MHFGLKINSIKNLLLVGITLVLLSSCKNNSTITYRNFLSPIAGDNVSAGNDFEVKIQFGAAQKVDSVVYLIDSVKVISRTDTLAINLKTKGLKLGSHLLVAKIFGEGKSDDLTANINVLPTQSPIQYSYKVIKTLLHDTSSYVEGLEYHDGFFYESAGEYGQSSLRKVDPSTGKILQKTNLEKKYFGEGMTVVDDKIIQVTWQEKTGFVYNKETFKKLSEFTYNEGTQEGWGLTFDGERILKTDGSNTIFFLDKNTYKKIGSIQVFDNKGPIDKLNELEYIEGKIYANVYTTDTIVIINPKTGAVEGRINLLGLLPLNYFKDEYAKNNNVLNGIAYDKATKRLFVTGKKWPEIYQIELKK